MNNINIFDQYLNGNLSSRDKAAFEQKLIENSNFKADFEAHQILISTFAQLSNNHSSDQKFNHFKNQMKQKMENQFQDFLSGHMKKSEVTDFNNRLAKDSFFALSFKRYKTQQTSILAQQAPSVKTFSIYPRMMVIAATLLLLIGAFWFLNFSGNESIYQELEKIQAFHPNVEWAEVEHLSFGTPIKNINLKKEGLQAYAKKDWKQAIDKLSLFLNNNDLSDQHVAALYLYLGRAYLKSGDTTLAISSFEKGKTIVTDRRNLSYAIDRMYWNLGLAYELNEEHTKARTTFSQLLSETNDPTFKPYLLKYLNQ